jgi:hypothetical protein
LPTTNATLASPRSTAVICAPPSLVCTCTRPDIPGWQVVECFCFCQRAHTPSFPSPTPVARRNKHPPFIIISPRLVPQPCKNDRSWSGWCATSPLEGHFGCSLFAVAARMHIVQIYSINANLLSSMSLCARTNAIVRESEIEGINSTFNLALIHGICTIFLLADATRCRIISPLC